MSRGTCGELVAAIAVLSAVGCVDSFGGANVQMTLREAVHTPADEGAEPLGAQPPAGTHYSIYSFDLVFARDADGAIVLDDDGERVVERSFAFRVFDFEILPHIDLESPCFIEREGDRFPGLHATQVAAKLREVTGIDDPLNPPSDASMRDVGDIIDADARVGFHAAISGTVKAVVVASTARLPRFDEGCIEDGADTSPNLVPPAACTGDDSNARRLTVCSTFWANNPTAYEGSDTVFTVPLNGQYLGHVDGVNPKNAGFIGGVTINVENSLEIVDALAITWQYKDLDGDGAPDFPDDLPAEERSEIGFHYMSGSPVIASRGTINVPLQNRTFSQITGEAVIIPSLDEDNVQF